MTVDLDNEATDRTTGRDPGETAADTPETRAEPETNPLRQQVRDRELAQRLDWRLLRRELPDVELQSLHATRVPIRQHLSGIADALGLPTVQEGDARHYRRLSLITRRGRIEKVIFPPENDIETHTRRIISWMQTARW